MNKTKEEILKDKFQKSPDGEYNPVHEAMDEYAKQMALAFEKWKAEEGWLPEESCDCYRSFYYNIQPGLSELYNLFLEHQKQQSI